MIMRFLCLAIVLLMVGSVGINAQTKRFRLASKSTARSKGTIASLAKIDNGQPNTFVPVTKFDPARDGAADIAAAVTEANRTGKRVLMDVGGEWCIWCHRMDEFFDEHASLRRLRDANFVMVKVNFSEENKNEALIASYGTVAGYPHIFVLESDGKLLHSQDTGLLEDGKKSYNLGKYTAFLKTWSPVRKPTKRVRHRRTVRRQRH